MESRIQAASLNIKRYSPIHFGQPLIRNKFLIQSNRIKNRPKTTTNELSLESTMIIKKLKQSQNKKESIFQQQVFNYINECNESTIQSPKYLTLSPRPKLINKKLTSQIENHFNIKNENRKYFKPFDLSLVIDNKQIECKNHVLINQEKLQTAQYSKLCQISGNKGGIQLKIFFDHFPFLKSNLSYINYYILKAFDINVKDHKCVITYPSFAKFYEVFIWKSKSFEQIFEIICKILTEENILFTGKQCIDFLDLVIFQLKSRAKKDIIQKIKRLLVHYKIISGKFSPINRNEFKILFSKEIIDAYDFINLISGNQL